MPHTWKALNTEGGGNCGFNAVALGIGFYFRAIPDVAARTEALNQWGQTITEQWAARNNAHLPTFATADLNRLKALITSFPGTADNLVAYQNSVSAILRKYTAPALKQEIGQAFRSFKSRENNTFYFPTLNGSVMQYTLGQAAPIAMTIPPSPADDLPDNDPAVLAYRAARKRERLSGDIYTLYADLRENITGFPRIPTMTATTPLHEAIWLHNLYLKKYKQLMETMMVYLPTDGVWATTRTLASCIDILHTPNVAFTPRIIQNDVLCQTQTQASTTVINLFNPASVHWELLKRESDCIAIAYPGSRALPVGVAAAPPPEEPEFETEVLQQQTVFPAAPAEIELLDWNTWQYPIGFGLLILTSLAYFLTWPLLTSVSLGIAAIGILTIGIPFTSTFGFNFSLGGVPPQPAPLTNPTVSHSTVHLNPTPKTTTGAPILPTNTPTL